MVFGILVTAIFSCLAFVGGGRHHQHRRVSPLPTHVHVGEAVYGVIHSIPMGYPSHYMGLCHGPSRKIWIRAETLQGEARTETLIHEILHAIFFEEGIKGTKSAEEWLVSTLSKRLGIAIHTLLEEEEWAK